MHRLIVILLFLLPGIILQSIFVIGETYPTDGCSLVLNAIADDAIWITVIDKKSHTVKAEGENLAGGFWANPGDSIRVRAIDTQLCAAGFGKPIGLETWDIFRRRWMGYKKATIEAA